MPDNPELEILFLIDNALREYLSKPGNKPDWLKRATCDNDNHDGEIIFELVDGTDIVVHSDDFDEVVPE